ARAPGPRRRPRSRGVAGVARVVEPAVWLDRCWEHQGQCTAGWIVAQVRPRVGSDGEEILQKQAPVSTGHRVGRNDPCPCDTGKRSKRGGGAGGGRGPGLEEIGGPRFGYGAARPVGGRTSAIGP